MNNTALVGQVNRLKVFNRLKRVMDREGRVPTGSEIAEHLGLSIKTVEAHMRALDGAVGLPLPMPGVSGRSIEQQRLDALNIGAAVRRMNRGHDFDPNALPLDKLFA